ncbi:flagellar basal body protein [Tepidibacillus marianensis]|uniref:flagellar hook-basal body protein n=1 Tax=Tepidibacillus marianensis TaxID=3131995 RepID=UPI0030D44332
MLTQQARQDLLTNNLANINTPGYKQDQAMIRSFPDVLIQQIRVPVTGGQQAIGSIAQGVFMEENVPLFIQGDLIDTGVKTQMAIWDSELQPNPNQQTKPTLLFTIQDPEGGRAYTRSGLFTEDSQGQLVTSEGYLVLDDQGKPIQTNGREFTIDPKGTLQFTDGQTLRLGLTKIDNPNQLLKQGNQIYRLQGGKEIFLL